MRSSLRRCVCVCVCVCVCACKDICICRCGFVLYQIPNFIHTMVCKHSTIEPMYFSLSAHAHVAVCIAFVLEFLCRSLNSQDRFVEWLAVVLRDHVDTFEHTTRRSGRALRH